MPEQDDSVPTSESSNAGELIPAKGRGRPPGIHTPWGAGQPTSHLKELTPKHKQAMSLLAQGLDRQSIADILELTPEYITMLASDPLCKEYIAGMNVVVDLQLEAMYGKVAQTINDAMTVGTIEERLKGARLQLEVTKRIGRNDRSPDVDPTVDRLATLAERLTGLLSAKREGLVIDGTAESIEVAGDTEPKTDPSSNHEE